MQKIAHSSLIIMLEWKVVLNSEWFVCQIVVVIVVVVVVIVVLLLSSIVVVVNLAYNY